METHCGCMTKALIWVHNLTTDNDQASRTAGLLGADVAAAGMAQGVSFSGLSLVAMSAEVNMCLYFVHSTVRSGSLALVHLYQQFMLKCGTLQ